jgi:hypothetical protein
LILRQLAVLALTPALLAGTARAGDEVAIQILQYGVFATEQVTPSRGSHETMKSATVTNVCHIATTSIVPAGGGEFGVRYRVIGPSIGTPVEIVHVLTYPDSRTPPGSPLAYVTNRQREPTTIGKSAYNGWANRNSRPGTWTFQIWENKRKLAEAVFTVVDKDEFKVQREKLRSDSDSACFPVSGLGLTVRSVA